VRDAAVPATSMSSPRLAPSDRERSATTAVSLLVGRGKLRSRGSFAKCAAVPSAFASGVDAAGFPRARASPSPAPVSLSEDAASAAAAAFTPAAVSLRANAASVSASWMGRIGHNQRFN